MVEGKRTDLEPSRVVHPLPGDRQTPLIYDGFGDDEEEVRGTLGDPSPKPRVAGWSDRLDSLPNCTHRRRSKTFMRSTYLTGREWKGWNDVEEGLRNRPREGVDR